MTPATAYPGRPSADEHLPYFGQYIDLVPDGDLISILERQVAETCAALGKLDPESVGIRPADSEWSQLDIAVHLADTERVLAHRAFVFARDDGAELPGVEFEAFAEAAGANGRTVDDIATELRAVRAATVALFRSLSAEAWMHRGTSSGSVISVRALAYAIAGHDRHHLRDLTRSGA